MSTAGVALNPTPPAPRAARRWRPNAGVLGGIMLACIALPCLFTLPWSLSRYDAQWSSPSYEAPSLATPMGTDDLGRPLLWRCLLGGAVSLGVGMSAALIAVVIGVTWGCAAGYFGGRVDAALMRIVDVFYGLPYILLVVMIDLAMYPLVSVWLGAVLPDGPAANSARLLTLLIAIGAVSWLTMARVIRGQVLSLRAQPFIEATRAIGAGPWRVLRWHLLPNLVGPIVVYSTLAVPAAMLQESFLSFLGIGVRPPMPSWGNLASDGLSTLAALTDPDLPSRWWLLVFPCLLLGLTLLSLNFLGDALRDKLDPKARK